MKKEMICKNCKYHYIEEISFDYPQSCCSKKMATTEGWCTCNAFEYSDRYIEQLQQENQELKEKYENAVADYETTMAEKEQLKKQVEEYKEQVNKGLYNTCLPYTTGYNKAIKDKEIQQKEFITYLNSYIDLLNDKPDMLEETQKDILEEILQKYKSIIGDIDDKK